MKKLQQIGERLQTAIGWVSFAIFGPVLIAGMIYAIVMWPWCMTFGDCGPSMRGIGDYRMMTE